MKFKELREKFNKLNEGYSKNLTDKDVDAQFKKFADWEGGAKAFFGDLDKARAEIKQDYSPANSARPTVWTALSYPVRDGDYYFAFISKNEKENMKYNEILNDFMKDVKKNGTDLVPAKKIGPDELYQAVGQYLEGEKVGNRKPVKFPRSLGFGDTMTREEIWGAAMHMYGKLSEDNINERGKTFFTKAGIKVGKRMKAPRFESVKEAKEMSRKDLMRKFGNEYKKALRGNSLDMSDKAEEALVQYIYDNHPEEIRTDDPDEWLEWLDDNLEDFVKGRGY